MINPELIWYYKTNATELGQQYDSVLHTLINLHAPPVTKKISLKLPNPWTTPAILASKRHRRYLERVWCRNPTVLNGSRHISAIDRCQRQNRLAIPKLLLSTLAIMGHYGRHLTKSYCCPKMHLPDHSSIAALANTFSSFYINKITVIRSSFTSVPHSHMLSPPETRKVLENLTSVTADEVRHLVLRAPCKSSDLDPIPTSLVKDCFDILITPITSIINLSLTQGSFPWQDIGLTRILDDCIMCFGVLTLCLDHVGACWRHNGLYDVICLATALCNTGCESQSSQQKRREQSCWPRKTLLSWNNVSQIERIDKR